MTKAALMNMPHQLVAHVKVSLVVEKTAPEITKERKDFRIFELEMDRINQAFLFMNQFRTFLECSLENLR